jgi:hypothetical protein
MTLWTKPPPGLAPQPPPGPTRINWIQERMRLTPSFAPGRSKQSRREMRLTFRRTFCVMVRTRPWRPGSLASHGSRDHLLSVRRGPSLSRIARRGPTPRSAPKKRTSRLCAPRKVRASRTPLSLETPSRVLMQRRLKSAAGIARRLARPSARDPNPQRGFPNQASGWIGSASRLRRSLLPLQPPTRRQPSRRSPEDRRKTRATTLSIRCRIPPLPALRARLERLRARRRWPTRPKTNTDTEQTSRELGPQTSGRRTGHTQRSWREPAQSTSSAHSPKTEGGANLIERWRLTSRGASLSRAVPVTGWRWTTDPPLRKKLLENKAANNFPRPAVASATSPTHRAQPQGGDIDVACRRGVSVLEGCADSPMKALILLELPLSKFEWKYKGSTAGKLSIIGLLVACGIFTSYSLNGPFSDGNEIVFGAAARLSSTTLLASTIQIQIGAPESSHPS